MPKLNNFHITPEQEDLFYKSIVINNGFYGQRADKKNALPSRAKLELLYDQSFFPTVAEYWNSLPPYQKQLWQNAAVWSFQSGWDLFAQDTAYRLANNIYGLGEPNVYHQYKVGHIHIAAPAAKINIKQVIFPFARSIIDFSVNFFSNLVAVASPSYCNFYFNFYADLGDGLQWYEEDLYIFNDTVWNYLFDSYNLAGYNIISAFVSIEINNMRGDLYFDGISLVGNDLNLLSDYNCNNIETSWQSVDVPAGASFQSVYSRNAFYY